MGITELIAAWGTHVLNATGVLGVFLLMVAESTLLPIPSEAVMPFAGFLIAEGTMSAPSAIGYATLGSLVGSLLSYAIGRFGGRPFVARYGRVLLLDARDLDRADRFFEKRGSLTVFLSRFVPIIRHVISIPAGVARMNLVSFSLFTVAGAAIWHGVLVGAGFLLRRNWSSVLHYAKWADVFILCLLAGLVALFVVRHARRRSAS